MGLPVKPKVSIIVPIYNVQDYLSRCLDSLLNQSLQEIEIIAINDGSTDKSLNILKDYAEKDERIILVNKANGGVSSARNSGIEIATGEYIGFVDPDDWIDKDMYQTMYGLSKDNKLDVVMCSYKREYRDHSKEKVLNLEDKTCLWGGEVQSTIMRRLVGPIKEEVSNPELLDAWGTVWSKLYRTELIRDNTIQFVDLSKIGTNEDTLFNIELFYYARSFMFTNQPFYHYWKDNPHSETEGHYKTNLINQWFYLYQYIFDFLNEKAMPAKFFDALNSRIGMNLLGLGLNTISKSNRDSASTKIKKINQILNDDRIKRSLKMLELSYFPPVWRTFYFMAKRRFSFGFYSMLVSIEFLRKRLR